MNSTPKGSESGFITIPANGQVSPPYAGKFIGCLSSPVNVQLSVDDGAKMVFGAGLKLRMPEDEYFQKITFFNDTNADVTIEITWGFGDIVDSRLTVTGSITVQNTVGTPLFVNHAGDQLAIGQASVTQSYSTIKTANSDRVSIELKNMGTDIVYITQGSGTAAVDGFPLYPFFTSFDVFKTSSKDEITARCAVGNSSKVAWAETYNS